MSQPYPHALPYCLRRLLPWRLRLVLAKNRRRVAPHPASETDRHAVWWCSMCGTEVSGRQDCNLGRQLTLAQPSCPNRDCSWDPTGKEACLMVPKPRVER
jgi:hypothetical protein